jgi:hypothetical protein
MRIFPGKLIHLDQRHIAGASHDLTVLAAALYRLKNRDAVEDSVRKRYLEDWNTALADSIAIDLQNEPPSLGRVTDPGTRGGHMDERLRHDWRGTTYNGTVVGGFA